MYEKKNKKLLSRLHTLQSKYTLDYIHQQEKEIVGTDELTLKEIVLNTFDKIIYFLSSSKRRKVANKFAEEFPSVLLATSSNIKAGLTVYSALERSIVLLPDDSVAKKEVKSFLLKINKGVAKDIAVKKFAEDIEIPELRLFRRAFLLVITNGGKFSRTLERLSQVCRERENLIKSARVSTASMRMTANILLAIAPLLIMVMSVRSKDYWKVLFNNSTAFYIGLSGTLIIFISYFILRRMSDFKP